MPQYASSCPQPATPTEIGLYDQNDIGAASPSSPAEPPLRQRWPARPPNATMAAAVPSRYASAGASDALSPQQLLRNSSASHRRGGQRRYYAIGIHHLQGQEVIAGGPEAYLYVTLRLGAQTYTTPFATAPAASSNATAAVLRKAGGSRPSVAGKGDFCTAAPNPCWTSVARLLSRPTTVAPTLLSPPSAGSEAASVATFYDAAGFFLFYWDGRSSMPDMEVTVLARAAGSVNAQRDAAEARATTLAQLLEESDKEENGGTARSSSDSQEEEEGVALSGSSGDEEKYGDRDAETDDKGDSKHWHGRVCSRLGGVTSRRPRPLRETEEAAWTQRRRRSRRGSPREASNGILSGTPRFNNDSNSDGEYHKADAARRAKEGSSKSPNHSARDAAFSADVMARVPVQPERTDVVVGYARVRLDAAMLDRAGRDLVRPPRSGRGGEQTGNDSSNRGGKTGMTMNGGARGHHAAIPADLLDALSLTSVPLSIRSAAETHLLRRFGTLGLVQFALTAVQASTVQTCGLAGTAEAGATGVRGSGVAPQRQSVAAAWESEANAAVRAAIAMTRIHITDSRGIDVTGTDGAGKETDQAVPTAETYIRCQEEQLRAMLERVTAHQAIDRALEALLQPVGMPFPSAVSTLSQTAPARGYGEIAGQISSTTSTTLVLSVPWAALPVCTVVEATFHPLDPILDPHNVRRYLEGTKERDLARAVRRLEILRRVRQLDLNSRAEWWVAMRRSMVRRARRDRQRVLSVKQRSGQRSPHWSRKASVRSGNGDGAGGVVRGEKEEEEESDADSGISVDALLERKGGRLSQLLWSSYTVLSLQISTSCSSRTSAQSWPRTPFTRALLGADPAQSVLWHAQQRRRVAYAQTLHNWICAWHPASHRKATTRGTADGENAEEEETKSLASTARLAGQCNVSFCSQTQAAALNDLERDLSFSTANSDGEDSSHSTPPNSPSASEGGSSGPRKLSISSSGERARMAAGPAAHRRTPGDNRCGSTHSSDAPDTHAQTLRLQGSNNRNLMTPALPPLPLLLPPTDAHGFTWPCLCLHLTEADLLQLRVEVCVSAAPMPSAAALKKAERNIGDQVIEEDDDNDDHEGHASASSFTDVHSVRITTTSEASSSSTSASTAVPESGNSRSLLSDAPHTHVEREAVSEGTDAAADVKAFPSVVDVPSSDVAQPSTAEAQLQLTPLTLTKSLPEVPSSPLQMREKKKNRHSIEKEKTGHKDVAAASTLPSLAVYEHYATRELCVCPIDGAAVLPQLLSYLSSSKGHASTWSPLSSPSPPSSPNPLSLLSTGKSSANERGTRHTMEDVVGKVDGVKGHCRVPLFFPCYTVRGPVGNAPPDVGVMRNVDATDTLLAEEMARGEPCGWLRLVLALSGDFSVDRLQTLYMEKQLQQQQQQQQQQQEQRMLEAELRLASSDNPRLKDTMNWPGVSGRTADDSLPWSNAHCTVSSSPAAIATANALGAVSGRREPTEARAEALSSSTPLDAVTASVELRGHVHHSGGSACNDTDAALPAALSGMSWVDGAAVASTASAAGHEQPLPGVSDPRSALGKLRNLRTTNGRDITVTTTTTSVAAGRLHRSGSRTGMEDCDALLHSLPTAPFGGLTLRIDHAAMLRARTGKGTTAHTLTSTELGLEVGHRYYAVLSFPATSAVRGPAAADMTPALPTALLCQAQSEPAVYCDGAPQTSSPSPVRVERNVQRTEREDTGNHYQQRQHCTSPEREAHPSFATSRSAAFSASATSTLTSIAGRATARPREVTALWSHDATYVLESGGRYVGLPLRVDVVEVPLSSPSQEQAAHDREDEAPMTAATSPRLIGSVVFHYSTLPFAGRHRFSLVPPTQSTNYPTVISSSPFPSVVTLTLSWSISVELQQQCLYRRLRRLGRESLVTYALTEAGQKWVFDRVRHTVVLSSASELLSSKESLPQGRRGGEDAGSEGAEGEKGKEAMAAFEALSMTTKAPEPPLLLPSTGEEIIPFSDGRGERPGRVRGTVSPSSVGRGTPLSVADRITLPPMPSQTSAYSQTSEGTSHFSARSRPPPLLYSQEDEFLWSDERRRPVVTIATLEDGKGRGGGGRRLALAQRQSEYLSRQPCEDLYAEGDDRRENAPFPGLSPTRPWPLAAVTSLELVPKPPKGARGLSAERCLVRVGRDPRGRANAAHLSLEQQRTGIRGGERGGGGEAWTDRLTPQPQCHQSEDVMQLRATVLALQNLRCPTCISPQIPRMNCTGSLLTPYVVLRFDGTCQDNHSPALPATQVIAREDGGGRSIPVSFTAVFDVPPMLRDQPYHVLTVEVRDALSRHLFGLTHIPVCLPPFPSLQSPTNAATYRVVEERARMRKRGQEFDDKEERVFNGGGKEGALGITDITTTHVQPLYRPPFDVSTAEHTPFPTTITAQTTASKHHRNISSERGDGQAGVVGEVTVRTTVRVRPSLTQLLRRQPLRLRLTVLGARNLISADQPLRGQSTQQATPTDERSAIMNSTLETGIGRNGGGKEGDHDDRMQDLLDTSTWQPDTYVVVTVRPVETVVASIPENVWEADMFDDDDESQRVKEQTRSPPTWTSSAPRSGKLENDPSCLRTREFRSCTVAHRRNPLWYLELPPFRCCSPADACTFTVFTADADGFDRCLGACDVSVEDLLNRMMDSHNNATAAARAEIYADKGGMCGHDSTVEELQEWGHDALTPQTVELNLGPRRDALQRLFLPTSVMREVTHADRGTVVLEWTMENALPDSLLPSSPQPTQQEERCIPYEERIVRQALRSLRNAPLARRQPLSYTTSLVAELRLDAVLRLCVVLYSIIDNSSSGDSVGQVPPAATVISSALSRDRLPVVLAVVSVEGEGGGYLDVYGSNPSNHVLSDMHSRTGEANGGNDDGWEDEEISSQAPGCVAQSAYRILQGTLKPESAVVQRRSRCPVNDCISFPPTFLAASGQTVWTDGHTKGPSPSSVEALYVSIDASFPSSTTLPIRLFVPPPPLRVSLWLRYPPASDSPTAANNATRKVETTEGSRLPLSSSTGAVAMHGGTLRPSDVFAGEVLINTATFPLCTTSLHEQRYHDKERNRLVRRLGPRRDPRYRQQDIARANSFTAAAGLGALQLGLTVYPRAHYDVRRRYLSLPGHSQQQTRLDGLGRDLPVRQVRLTVAVQEATDFEAVGFYSVEVRCPGSGEAQRTGVVHERNPRFHRTFEFAPIAVAAAADGNHDDDDCGTVEVMEVRLLEWDVKEGGAVAEAHLVALTSFTVDLAVSEGTTYGVGNVGRGGGAEGSPYNGQVHAGSPLSSSLSSPSPSRVRAAWLTLQPTSVDVVSVAGGESGDQLVHRRLLSAAGIAPKLLLRWRVIFLPAPTGADSRRKPATGVTQHHSSLLSSSPSPPSSGAGQTSAPQVSSARSPHPPARCSQQQRSDAELFTTKKNASMDSPMQSSLVAAIGLPTSSSDTSAFSRLPEDSAAGIASAPQPSTVAALPSSVELLDPHGSLADPLVLNVVWLTGELISFLGTGGSTAKDVIAYAAAHGGRAARISRRYRGVRDDAGPQRLSAYLDTGGLELLGLRRLSMSSSIAHSGDGEKSEENNGVTASMPVQRMWIASQMPLVTVVRNGDYVQVDRR